MKKNLFAFIVTLACLMNISFAEAQDIWLATNGDGSAWYVIDETIEGDDTGKFRWTNADFKLVKRDGSFKIVSWKFTQTKPDDGRLANWVYEIDYGDGKKYTENVLTGTNAEKFLTYCLNRKEM